MLNKRCFTAIPCDLSAKCALSSTPQSQTRQYFQPPRTGEACDSFIPRNVTRREQEESND